MWNPTLVLDVPVDTLSHLQASSVLPSKLNMHVSFDFNQFSPMENYSQWFRRIDKALWHINGEMGSDGETQGCCAIWAIRPKLSLNSNLSKSRSSITSVSVVDSLRTFAQNTKVQIPCSVQTFGTIKQLRNKLGAIDTSVDLSLRCFSDGYPMLHRVPVVKVRTRCSTFKESNT